MDPDHPAALLLQVTVVADSVLAMEVANMEVADTVAAMPVTATLAAHLLATAERAASPAAAKEENLVDPQAVLLWQLLFWFFS